MAKSRSGGIDKLLANIWEKIVLGVAVLITLGLIIMSATGGSPVEVTPEQLTQLASRAEQNYKTTEPKPQVEFQSYAKVAQQIREPVSSTGYQIAAPFDPPVFEQRKKRGQPPIFPIRDLRAAAGHGAVAGLAAESTGAMGGYPGYPGSGSTMPTGAYPSATYYGGETSSAYPGSGYSGSSYPGSGYSGYGGTTGPSHGRRWVVVTGLIDWEKQIKAFRDTFQDAIRAGNRSTSGYPGYSGSSYPGMTSEESTYSGSGYPGASGYSGSSYPGSSGYSRYGGMPGDVEFPQFVYFNIERAEVSDESAPVDSLRWETLNARARWFEEQRVAHDQFMYVSPEYVMPRGQVPLTWPLVQLTAGDTWSKDVAHEPEIPFLELPRAAMGYGPYATMGGYPGSGYTGYPGGSYPGSGYPGATGSMGPGGVVRTGTQAGTAGAQGNQTEGTTANGQGQGESGTQPSQTPQFQLPDEPIDPTRMVPGASSPYGYGGYGTTPGGAYPTTSGESPYGTGYPEGYAGYPGSEGGYGSGYPGYPGSGTMMLRKEAPVKLFRFVDYKVEPGKKYRYRVKLWLANPNYKLPPQILEDESFSKEAWLITDWCNPSNVVRVPFDTGVLAGPAKAGRVPFIEPRVTVGITVFRPTPGLTSFKEFPDQPRGTILDFSAADVKKMNPPKKEKKTTTSPYGSSYGSASEGSAEYGVEGSMPGMGYPGPGGSPSGYPGYPGYAGTTTSQTQEEPELDYFTRLMILDISGGEQLPNKESAPSTVVFVDPEGNLILRDELEDSTQYKRFTETGQKTGLYGEGYPGSSYPGGEMSTMSEQYSEYYSEMEGGRGRRQTRGSATTRPRTTSRTGTTGTGTRGRTGTRGGP